MIYKIRKRAYSHALEPQTLRELSRLVRLLVHDRLLEGEISEEQAHFGVTIALLQMTYFRAVKIFHPFGFKT